MRPRNETGRGFIVQRVFSADPWHNKRVQDSKAKMKLLAWTVKGRKTEGRGRRKTAQSPLLRRRRRLSKLLTVGLPCALPSWLHALPAGKEADVMNRPE